MLEPTRRKVLGFIVAALIAAGGPGLSFAKDGGSGSDGGGGDNSGPGGGGGDDNSGKGGGGNDDGDDDEDDRDAATAAVRDGQATPLRILLKTVAHSYPGDVVDVKLRRTGQRFTYRIKILDRKGHLITVDIDAKSQRILPRQGL
jgi:hypothetical protein